MGEGVSAVAEVSKEFLFLLRAVDRPRCDQDISLEMTGHDKKTILG
jgi:hypothetical protein